jgi:hypothetical protein
MQENLGKETFLYNLAPNGLKIDRVYLTQVPNADNSGFEFLIEYREDHSDNEKTPIGHCELIMGSVCFDKVGNNAKTLGINYTALKLLVEWIETNIEPI